jgi:hypothetical protein
MKLIEVRDDAPIGEQLDIMRQNQTALLNETQRLETIIDNNAEEIEKLKESIQKVADYLE